MVYTILREIKKWRNSESDTQDFDQMNELNHFIISCLRTYYQIEALTLTLLPIGADPSASLYKVDASNQKTYFVKLKQGHCQNARTAILELLQMAGIRQIIPPIKTVEGQTIQQINDFTLIVYPFIEGQDGFNRPLTDKQWIALGKLLRQIHEIDVPTPLTRISHKIFRKGVPNRDLRGVNRRENIIHADKASGDLSQYQSRGGADFRKVCEKCGLGLSQGKLYCPAKQPLPSQDESWSFKT